MDMGVPERVHVAPFGVERDRIVWPAVEYDADTVVLLDYITQPVPARPDRETIAGLLDDHGIAHEYHDVTVRDIFDALAVVGAAITDHADDDV